MDSSDQNLPLSRSQVHALRVTAETFKGETITIPREGFLLLVGMAESLRSKSCSRCGAELQLTSMLASKHFADRMFCGEFCLAQWEAVELGAAANSEPQYVVQRPGYFSGHCVIKTKALMGAALAAGLIGEDTIGESEHK